MPLEIEYEKRSMLSKKEYLKILDFIKTSNLNFKTIRQKNHYFDIDKSKLRDKGFHLRVRKVMRDKSYDLTLKIDQNDKFIELHQYLSYETFLKMKQTSFFPNGEIKDFINSKNFNTEDIKYYGYLYTYRIELNQKDHLLVLDKNIYNGIHDYNIEIESSSLNEADKFLFEYINKFNIEIKEENRGKNARFFSTL